MHHLWLDLDHTLVCAMPGLYPEHPPEHILHPESWLPNYDTVFYIYKRPGLDTFLQTLSQHPRLTLHLWTAGSRAYAEGILGAIGVRDTLITVLGREDCMQSPCGDPIKDLRVLKHQGFPLDSVIFVDDHPERLRYEEESWVIRIGSFTGDPDDQRLELLTQAILARIEGRPDHDLSPISAPIDIHWYESKGWTWVYDPEGRRFS